MSYLPPLPSIGIFINEDIDYSSLCMKQCLQNVSCHVDFIALASHDNASLSHSVVSFNSSDYLAHYDLLIYQYSDDFLMIAPYLNEYHGHVMIVYDTDNSIVNLRAYHHASQQVRQLELARQVFSEWVQGNAQRLFFLAGSPRAAHDLISWGVKDSIHSIATVPSFIKLKLGQYADKHTSNSTGTMTILVAGECAPDTGHIKIIDVINDYQQSFSNAIQLQFVGKEQAELLVYKEEVEYHIQRHNLSAHIQLIPSNSAIELDRYLQADLMLFMGHKSHYSTAYIQAQAMGLAIMNFMADDDNHAIAQSLHHALYDDKVREQLVVDSYRYIANRYTHEHIEQQFLSRIILALNGGVI